MAIYDDIESVIGLPAGRYDEKYNITTYEFQLAIVTYWQAYPSKGEYIEGWTRYSDPPRNIPLYPIAHHRHPTSIII